MTFKSKARRAGWLLVVAAFALGIMSAVWPKHTDAYSLISSRYIKMSSSEAGATNTIYNVAFDLTAGQTIGSIIIRFCSNNPIIGDACQTTATGFSTFNTNKSTLSINNQGGTNAAGQTCTNLGFVVSSSILSGEANTVVLTRTPAAVASNTHVCFELGNGSTNGITNPNNSNVTFFARILVHISNNPTMSAPGDENNATNIPNAGGVALSTTNVLNVTAKVQEALTFCLYTGANCAAGGNAVNLGDSNNVLAAMNTYYTDATPKFDLASNALGGVVVRLKGDTLKSGSFSIDPQILSNTCAADSVSTSVEQFGVRVVTYGSGQQAETAGKYDCLAGNHMFDVTNANTTYGQGFVKTLGATDVSTTNFELGAKAANTTEAGVYTTKLQFIATATY
jgi:hypothetical protein